jgi:hypothetical protein
MHILNMLLGNTGHTDSRATRSVDRSWRDHKFFLATLLLVIACSLSLAPTANAKYSGDDDKKSEKRDSKSSRQESKESKKSDKDSKKDKDRKHSEDDDGDKGKGHHDDDDDDKGKGKGHHDDDDDDKGKGKGHHDDDDDDDDKGKGHHDDDDEGHKVEICHFPPGNPANAQTIHVSEKSLERHYSHGDYAGACNDDSPCPGSNACVTYEPVDGVCQETWRYTCDDSDACTVDTCVDVGGLATCEPAPIYCEPQDECYEPGMCFVDSNGAALCPREQFPVEDGTLCANGTGTCENGSCNIIIGR